MEEGSLHDLLPILHPCCEILEVVKIYGVSIAEA